MASDNTSLKSSGSKPKTPGADAGRKVGFARPTLIIPPPQIQRQYSPYATSRTFTPGTGKPTPEMYSRKASTFMFDQFNGIKDFTMSTAKSGMGMGEKYSYWMYSKIKTLSRKWFTHFFLSIVLIIYTIGGALMFTTIEGQNETRIVERDLRRDRYELIRELHNYSIMLPEPASIGEWEGKAFRTLVAYETKLIEYYQSHSLIVANRGNKVWTMWNSIVYCATIYTTIGYGHLYPTTITGRALTIVYSIIGIPLFLIALTDFGKLFTRAIKFLWSFVRRLYYTGSCRKYRKTAHVQEIFKGAQLMYDIATFKRPSISTDPSDPENPQDPQLSKAPSQTATTVLTESDTPTTPAISNYEIDDEFNLPISVALFILIAYIFIGALIYCMWEDWNFFASFYFVFISMSTIGFGDFVPRNPACMIVSIVYLVFGLALMSMCINVVQLKLSDTFQQASAKLGASIGFDTDEDGSLAAAENVEVVPVHGANEAAAAVDPALVEPMVEPMVKTLVNRITKGGEATSQKTLNMPDKGSGAEVEKRAE